MSTINCLTNRKLMLHSYYSRCQRYQSCFCRRIIFEKIIETGKRQDNSVHFSLLKATMLTFKRLLLILSDETKCDFVGKLNKHCFLLCCFSCFDKRNVLLTNKVIPFILKGEVTALNNFSIKKASVANR